MRLGSLFLCRVNLISYYVFLFPPWSRKWFVWWEKSAFLLLLSVTITFTELILYLVTIFISKWWSMYTVIRHFGGTRKRWGLALILCKLFIYALFVLTKDDVHIVLTFWDVTFWMKFQLKKAWYVSGTSQGYGHYIEVNLFLVIFIYPTQY